MVTTAKTKITSGRQIRMLLVMMAVSIPILLLVVMLVS